MDINQLIPEHIIPKLNIKKIPENGQISLSDAIYSFRNYTKVSDWAKVLSVISDESLNLKVASFVLECFNATIENSSPMTMRYYEFSVFLNNLYDVYGIADRLNEVFDKLCCKRVDIIKERVFTNKLLREIISDNGVTPNEYNNILESVRLAIGNRNYFDYVLGRGVLPDEKPLICVDGICERSLIILGKCKLTSIEDLRVFLDGADNTPEIVERFLGVKSFRVDNVTNLVSELVENGIVDIKRNDKMSSILLKSGKVVLEFRCTTLLSSSGIKYNYNLKVKSSSSKGRFYGLQEFLNKKVRDINGELEYLKKLSSDESLCDVYDIYVASSEVVK